MVNHQGQISIPATVVRGLVYVSTAVSYSLAYYDSDVMDNDNIATTLSALIQVSRVLICTVRKLSVEPVVLAKRWGITPEKAKKTIQAKKQRGIRTMFHPSLLKLFRTNDRNLSYHCLACPVFSDWMFASTVSKRGNRFAQVYVTDLRWARAFPMASRSEEHETLLLMFARDGVPPG